MSTALEAASARNRVVGEALLDLLRGRSGFDGTIDGIDTDILRGLAEDLGEAARDAIAAETAPLRAALETMRALTTPERVREAAQLIQRDRDESHGRAPVDPPPEDGVELPMGPYDGWLKSGDALAAAQVAPPQIHDPERDRRITDLLIATNREVERRRTVTSALHVAGEALGELLAPYTGGAPSAFEDPHIRERAEQAYERSVALAAAFGQGSFRATHIHKKSHGLYRLLLLGERESDLHPVAVYAGSNGRVWVRDLWEFMDGRFRRLGEEGAL